MAFVAVCFACVKLCVPQKDALKAQVTSAQRVANVTSIQQTANELNTAMGQQFSYFVQRHDIFEFVLLRFHHQYHVVIDP
jgi:hypothetical protein